jgi:hypothetical protein
MPNPLDPADAVRAALWARIKDAGRALLGAAIRHLLVAIGAALVTRGWIDQGHVDGVIPMAVEVGVGAVFALVGFGWGQVRAFLSHTRWAAAWAALRADSQAGAPTSPTA